MLQTGIVLINSPNSVAKVAFLGLKIPICMVKLSLIILVCAQSPKCSNLVWISRFAINPGHEILQI